jgi:putative transposon-encoded protein
MRRCACGVARRMMEEGAVSVKCGDWVLVEDVVAYEGRVVLVIGVTAVISVTCEDTDGDTYRAAELRYCRPGLDAMSVDAPHRPAWPRSHMPRRGRRVTR